MPLDDSRRLFRKPFLQLGAWAYINRAEAVCQLPPGLSGGQPSWLVLYDAPGPDRRDGEHAVLGDLLQHG